MAISDWAGSIDDMKSTSCYAFLFGSNIYSLVVKKQNIIAQSIVEAEYVSTTKATSQAIWLGRILEDIGKKIKRKGLFCYAIANHALPLRRTQYISIKYHFIREAQKKVEI